MNLWLISQSVNTGHDTYDSAVVAAETEDEARNILPASYYSWQHDNRWCRASVVWAAMPDQVTVKHIGEAALSIERGVVLASFNAG